MRVVFCSRHGVPERRLYRGRTGKLLKSRWVYPPLSASKYLSQVLNCYIKYSLHAYTVDAIQLLCFLLIFTVGHYLTRWVYHFWYFFNTCTRKVSIQEYTQSRRSCPS